MEHAAAHGQALYQQALDMREDKLRRLEIRGSKLSDEAECTFVPQPAPKTGDLEARIAQRAEVPVHERLYDIARLEGRAMENERLREEREMRGVTFEPQLVSAPFARGN